MKNCECMAWARTFEETQGGRFPPSNHHPECSKHEKKRYARLEVDGTAVIVDFMPDDTEEFCSVSHVYLTEDQFLRLQESTGF